jgi:hypothetical protein
MSFRAAITHDAILYTFIAWFYCASVNAQECVTYYYPVQCYGGACQPQQYYYSPPQQQQIQYQQPSGQAPVAPEYKPRPVVPNSNPSDGVSLLPWRDGIEKRLTAIDQKLTQVVEDAKGWESAGKCECDHENQVTKDDLKTAIAGIQHPEVTQIDYTKIVIDYEKLGAVIAQNVKVPEAPAVEGEQHIVIVADRNSPYWPRIAAAIDKAKETYPGIRVAGLPASTVGTYPKGVVYENSIAVRVVSGQYEVENLISRASRGEAI